MTLIKKLRIVLNITVTTISEKTLLSEHQISLIERGSIAVPNQLLSYYANKIEISNRYLVPIFIKRNKKMHEKIFIKIFDLYLSLIIRLKNYE